MINTYKLKLHILQIAIVLSAFFTLFVPNVYTGRTITSILITIYAILSFLIIKRKDKVLSYKKQIIWQMIGFAGIYVAINYLLGMYFGFYKNYTSFTFELFLKNVVPFTIVIIFSEILRYEFLNLKDKNFKIVTFIAMVLVDISMYLQMYDISKLNDFLSVLGLVIFASIACNLLYNYISSRYGYKPIIVYRLITVLYIFIMPVVPDIYEFLQAMISIIFPYFIYLFLEYAYVKNKKVETPVSKGRKITNIIIVVAIALFIVLIISCNFYIGIIAVGSESMTGTVNKGDAVVFIKYTDQEIQEGDVIIFNKNNQTVVHRVVRIRERNNQRYYYTKGDNNQEEDSGYITDDNIIGISKFKIKYIGFPTIWVKDAFAS